jgi:hypothetical protein
MHRLLLAALFVTFMPVADQLQAQTSNKNRGRLFQRLREDLFGGNESAPRASTAQSQGRQQGQPQPTHPQDQYSGQPQAENNQSVMNTRNSTRGRASNSSQNAPQRFRLSDDPGQPDPSVATAQSGRNNRRGGHNKGFGMTVAGGSSGGLVVAHVDPNGNAYQAGVRRGDRILELGGIEASDEKEFQEIEAAMADGDQLELRLRRGGKENKVLVLFGEDVVPSTGDAERNPESVSTGQDAFSERTATYDFAPPATDGTMRSVLDNPQARLPVTAANNLNNDRHLLDRQLRSLNQTISQQQVMIQQLKEENQRLRRSMKPRR